MRPDDESELLHRLHGARYEAWLDERFASCSPVQRTIARFQQDGLLVPAEVRFLVEYTVTFKRLQELLTERGIKVPGTKAARITALLGALSSDEVMTAIDGESRWQLTPAGQQVVEAWKLRRAMQRDDLESQIRRALVARDVQLALRLVLDNEQLTSPISISRGEAFRFNIEHVLSFSYADLDATQAEREAARIAIGLSVCLDEAYAVAGKRLIAEVGRMPPCRQLEAWFQRYDKSNREPDPTALAAHYCWRRMGEGMSSRELASIFSHRDILEGIDVMCAYGDPDCPLQGGQSIHCKWGQMDELPALPCGWACNGCYQGRVQGT